MCGRLVLPSGIFHSSKLDITQFSLVLEDTVTAWADPIATYRLKVTVSIAVVNLKFERIFTVISKQFEGVKFYQGMITYRGR